MKSVLGFLLSKALVPTETSSENLKSVPFVPVPISQHCDFNVFGVCPDVKGDTQQGVKSS
jgi:hypothetical protein